MIEIINKKNVILLHGLARTNHSMNKIANYLNINGYNVCNISYPSRKFSIDKLVSDHVVPKIEKFISEIPDQSVNFVSHSLGCILVRAIAKYESNIPIGRVIMLSPPNKGSEIVDKIGGWKLFALINGPAGLELGTDKNSMPNKLGPATFELGVITGNRSINLILSTLIEGENDGKVSVNSAQLEGMKDFLVIPSPHPFIMRNRTAIEQIIYFLESGCFLKSSQEK